MKRRRSRSRGETLPTTDGSGSSSSTTGSRDDLFRDSTGPSSRISETPPDDRFLGEVPEDTDLAIYLGDWVQEFDPEELKDRNSAAPEDTLPQRKLTNFKLVDELTGNLLTYQDLIFLEGGIEEVKPNIHIRETVPIAYGTVSRQLDGLNDDDDEPLSEVDDDDEDEEAIKCEVKLSVIFYMDTGPELSISIRTQYAWYTLGVPHPDYKGIWERFFVRQALVASICEIIDLSAPFDDRRVVESEVRDLNDLVRSFSGMDEEMSSLPLEIEHILGRTLTRKDWIKHASWVREHIAYLHENGEYFQFEANVRHSLCKDLKLFTNQVGRRSDTSPELQGRPRSSTLRRSRFQSHVAALRKFRRPHYLPPITKRNAAAMYTLPDDFPRPDDDGDILTSFGWPGPDAIIPDDPPPEKRSLRIPVKKENETLRFIRVGETEYRPLDYVQIDLRVLQGRARFQLEQTSYRLSHVLDDPVVSTNPAAHQRVFGRILQIEDEKKHTPRAHVLLLDHAAVRMGESHHPYELFLLNECASIKVTTFEKKITVNLLPDPTQVPTFHGGDEYFVRYRWDENDMSYRSLHSILDIPSDVESCWGCSPQIQREPDSATSEEVCREGKSYHLGEFVYIPNAIEGRDPKLLTVAQILKIQSVDRIYVRLFVPHDPKKSLRCLERVDESAIHISSQEIHSKCFVVTTMDWELQIKKLGCTEGDLLGIYPNLYHVTPMDLRETGASSSKPRATEPPAQEACKTCLTEALEALPSRLNILDVFCGAGGATQGLVRSGVAIGAFANDISRSACKTYLSSNPGARVVADDFNHWQDYVANRQAACLSIYNKPMAPFPKEGEVDIIVMGPPCQGYSSLNRFQRANDPKNTHIIAGLGSLETLKPRYFIIEEVPRMPAFPLKAHDEGNQVVGGIDWGTWKFIVRTCLDHGYQLRGMMLNAEDFGTPQSRRRFFCVGARWDCPLPDIPPPTHIIPDPSVERSKEVLRRQGIFVPPAHQFAAHKLVTVRDAIGDLPPFDWENPLLKPSKWEAVPRPEDENLRFGPRELDLHYRDIPSNDFQRWIRARPVANTEVVSDGREMEVTHHYTYVFDKLKTERVTLISQHPEANHHSLPRSHRVPGLSGTTGAQARNNYYPAAFARIEKHGFFPTVATSVDPEKKQGRTLHYVQRRVCTVRECARAQGFSDLTDFQVAEDANPNSEKERYRQIGNAVPIPLTMAIGRTIRDAELARRRRDLQPSSAPSSHAST
ncbi:S-adenosyl-L-methionine-dependent methyltransferase [Clavulina sp. PMI_390]|nr:S-adenosyl-L-methionine-dependent methyltransferase [Clavulina sp. PMI_390]